jgi:hypothetical protein
MNIQGGGQTRADQLQDLVTKIAARYPNQSIMVGGATADVNGRPLTIVQVSNRGPYLDLHRNPEILAQFARDARLNPNEVRLALREPSKNDSQKLWRQGHVERVAVQSLQATGAREGIATASGQACERCTDVWLAGRQFHNWVHLLVPE